MLTDRISKTILSLASGFALILSMFSFATGVSVQAQSVPPTEPNCQQVSTSPVWNPYPLVTNLPNPDITSGACKDMPLLSWFPIDTANNNPRTQTILQSQNISFHVYYNNGATPGSAAIQNPNLKVQVVKLSNTQYRLSAILSGSNVPTVTSAQKGGDLILNVPAGTQLDIVGQNTLHFPDAIERKYQADTTGASPSDLIPDNSQGSSVSNPIYSQFDGKTLGSTAGFNLKPGGLEAGFLGYGYVLGQLAANVQPQNLPPVVPGQEITIIRGQSGSFQVINGSDPDNNVPLTYTPNNLPSWCTYDMSTRIITCQTNAQTPVRTTFTVTPTDSLGLSGNPAPFIVNVIEPGLNITKTCVKKGTTTPCDQAQLQPNDQVSYTINIANSGSAPATNVRVVDDYDQSRLTNITNITPSSGTHDQANGVITWTFASLANGQSQTMSFDATISQAAQNGDVIVNVARVSADGIPEKEAQVQFPIGTGTPILNTSDKLCYKKGTNTPCDQARLTIGDQVVYMINVRNTGTIPATSVQVIDTYDKSKLTGVGNMNPNGTLDTNAGTITWQVGTVNAGETKTLTFEATVAQNVTNGTIIVNTATIKVPGQPDTVVRVQFPVYINVAGGTPRSGGLAVGLTIAGLLALGGGYWFYNRSKNKHGKAFIPARSSEAVIDAPVKKASKK